MKGGFILHGDLLVEFNKQPYRPEDPNYQLYRNMEIIRRIFSTPNVNFTLVSDKSRYGYIFKADIPELPFGKYLAYEFKPGCEDGLRNDKCYRPVRSYIIKLVFIGDHDQDIPRTRKSYNGRNQFIEECLTQYNLYNKNFLNGLYLIPPMFFPEPLFLKETIQIEGQAQPFNNMILSTCNTLVNIHDIFQQLGEQNDIGLVVMGFAEGYTTMHNAIKQYPRNPEIRRHIRLLGKFALLLLCINYGYYHGDAHLANIMVNVNYESPHEWYNGIHNGRVLLIDFGRSRKIPEYVDTNEMGQQLTVDIIEGFRNDHKYQSILRLINYVGPPYGIDNPYYSWIVHPEQDMDQDDNLRQMFNNYNHFQNSPPHNQYKNINVQRMRHNIIFGKNTNVAAVPAAIEGGQKKQNKSKKSRKSRKGYKLCKYRKSNRRK